MSRVSCVGSEKGMAVPVGGGCGSITEKDKTGGHYAFLEGGPPKASRKKGGFFSFFLTGNRKWRECGASLMGNRFARVASQRLLPSLLTFWRSVV